MRSANASRSSWASRFAAGRAAASRCEHPVDQSAEGPRQVRTNLLERRRARLDPARGLEHRAVPERMPAREALPEHDADRPHVRRGIAGVSLEPLGRDVGERPGDVARGRQRLLLRELGKPEVEQPHGELLALGDEDVRRLDVAVDDSARVRVRKRLEHLRRGLDRRAIVELAGAEGLAHRLARHVLVGDVDVAGVALERVGAQAALVPEPSRRERLPLGARRSLALARDDLQRDVEAGPLVAREPDRPGTAAAERAQGPIVLGHELAWGQRKCRLGHDP